MEEYWNNHPITHKDTSRSTVVVATNPNKDKENIELEYGQHCHILLQKTAIQSDPGGWKAELPCYLSDMPVDVSKDTNIISWWSTHPMIYPMLSWIAMDVYAIPATSIATNHHSCLGGEKFEYLQVLKHAWQDKVTDHAAANSTEIDEVYVGDFRELLRTDNKLSEWDKVDEVITL
ncbi:hypothetical protein PAXRUDRAFT_158032 [Paxillus rubicundulus Ve08.2h10]|uniref:HAT C-terminal dimerisation domain-containing protein n=1 Tax=Paxillus rubicundulus Ve08.2h10 TaxID=930991 RepID=A0A0D0DH36_9AGAM|nr:hypothetical protein PAXRUDRAFT_158032 [Paxillus rubicundulus Ve08.2h10]